MELLTVEFVPGAPPTLKLTGEIDLSTGAQVKTAIEETLAAHSDVVIDMAGVTFVDACGLRAVLEVATSLNGSGPLRLSNAARVGRLLDLVGLSGSGLIVISDEAVERSVVAGGR
ncbi:MAG: STAS domain-containing protein [Actinobacteria bacterium]|nr:STAS domain-containing protein [Actinomycetota bacterium]